MIPRLRASLAGSDSDRVPTLGGGQTPGGSLNPEGGPTPGGDRLLEGIDSWRLSDSLRGSHWGGGQT